VYHVQVNYMKIHVDGTLYRCDDVYGGGVVVCVHVYVYVCVQRWNAAYIYRSASTSSCFDSWQLTGCQWSLFLFLSSTFQT